MRSWRDRFPRLGPWGVTTVFLFGGCAGLPGAPPRLARYRPDEHGRTPWRWVSETPAGGLVGDPSSPPGEESLGGSSAPASPTRLQESEVTPPPASPERPVAGGSGGKRLRMGDNVRVYLRGIPQPEEIWAVVDDTGQINLPLLGKVHVAGLSAGEVESHIERQYTDGGYYNKITVIVVAQEPEYFVRGEVKREGKYRLTGDLTLLMAIAEAGGFTDYAKRTEVQILRGRHRLVFDTKRIEKLKAEDPAVQPGDILIVPRRWLW